jgi:hypothetical protein
VYCRYSSPTKYVNIVLTHLYASLVIIGIKISMDNDITHAQIIEDVDGTEKEDLGELEETRSDPFNPKEVDIQVVSSVMDLIIKRLKNNEIDLIPGFQRSPDLWKKSLQGRLIESLLINLPIPAFYFDAKDDEKWQIVDGLQRLSTIKNFVVDKTSKLSGLEFLKEYDGSTYDELPRTLQRRIEEFPVTLYLIKPGTPSKMKYSLFHRINTGGMSLKPQEIRHAINQGINNGRASLFLKELSEHDDFCRLVRIQSNRMSNSELVLRHISFVIQGKSIYKSSMIRYLDDGMELLGGCSEQALKTYENGFKRSMQLAWRLFEEHAFKKSFVEASRIKVINKPLFESLSAALSSLSDSESEILVSNKSVFLESFKVLMRKSEFSNSISKSTANKEAFNYRFVEMEKLVHKFCTE